MTLSLLCFYFVTYYEKDKKFISKLLNKVHNAYKDIQ